jgi:probable F420-dependent oxidoreductase
MELGIALPHTGPHASPQAMVQVAQAAEKLDYGSVWVLERLLRPTFPIPQPRGGPAVMAETYAIAYEPIESLVYIAAHTQKIKLGTSVIDAPFHVPVVLSKRFAALDQFSNGRAIAGLGQGSNDPEFETANVSKKRRGAGFEEFILALKAAWGPDPVKFDGRFYKIAESNINPKPVQPGGPPVIVGALAPAAVERAARVADGWNPVVWAWEPFEKNLKIFHEAARAAGRDPAKQLIVVRANVKPGSPAGEQRALFTGSMEQLAEDFARLRTYGVQHIFFDMNFAGTTIDEMLRLLEPVRKALG